jgi:hypothetical protein
MLVACVTLSFCLLTLYPVAICSQPPTLPLPLPQRLFYRFVYRFARCFFTLTSTFANVRDTSRYVWCYTKVRQFLRALVGTRLFGSKWETQRPLQTGALLCVSVGATVAAVQAAQGEYGVKSMRSTVSDLWTECDLREGHHPGMSLVLQRTRARSA